MTWEIVFLICLGVFLLDWIYFLPLFSSIFAYENRFVWNPPSSFKLVILSAFWLLGILGAILTNGLIKILSLILLWCFFRKYFVQNRWKSVRRGCGAPGLMSYWTCSYLLLIEVFRLIDGTGVLVNQGIFAMRFDFALIMICAGTYKASVGFLSHEGMEFGRVNPIWGYHWKKFSQNNPNGFYPHLMNCLASIVEIAGGILLLIPYAYTQLPGAFLISASFIYVSLFIRLGRLAWLMALLPLVFLPEVIKTATITHPLFQLSNQTLQFIQIVIVAYMVVLPVVKICQYINLFGNKNLPYPIQGVINFFTENIPIIIWRVFTPDLINFYCRVKAEKSKNYFLSEDTYSYKKWKNIIFKMKMLHVCESIAQASVFTTLKYYPKNTILFNEKLIRYLKSLLNSTSPNLARIQVEYIAIVKKEKHFSYEKKISYFVNLITNEVKSFKHDQYFSPKKRSEKSPIRPSIRQGIYAKK